MCKKLTDVLRSIPAQCNQDYKRLPEVEPLGSEFMKYVRKYIRFSHAIIQYGERFYELLLRSNKVRLLEHHTLPLKDYTCGVHIKQDQIVNGFNFKQLREFFEDMPYKLLGVNCICFVQYVVYHLTKKIIDYKYIPGYNLLIPPEERTLKGYIDYYFRPEYKTMGSASAQIEDMWDSIEQIYPKVQFKVPNFVSIDKSESAFFDYFTDFSFVEDTKKIYNKYRDNRKTVWFPLINLVKHRHVSFVGKKIYRDIDHNLKIPDKKTVILDLQSIQDYYIKLFEISIDLNIHNIKNELYTIGITVPLRKFDIEIDTITARMINELKEKYPHPEGIFTRRLGTLNMVKKSNDRYFVDTKQTKLDEDKEDEITKAVYNQLRPILENSTLMSPEEVLKKWHIAYSWGFPYRFLDGNDNMSRRKVIYRMGGRQVFLKKIRQYLEGDIAIPSVSHVFLKDEVLKLSKVEIEEKIRSIIAMDPLTYFNGMLVNGCQNKNFDPMNGCAIGMSSAHAIPPLIFEQYRSYKVHLQMDITFMDSTMTWKELTGMLAEDFFKYNKITAYGDDNVLSSNCFNDKWNEDTLCNYFAKKDKKQLEEVLKYVSDYTCKVTYKHNRDKLLMKFDDIKKNPKKNKTYLLERIIGLANNCAHYPDIHEICVKYYNELIEAYYSHMKAIRKRCPIKSYEEVMHLQYEYRYNELVTLDMSSFEQFIRNARAFVHEVDFKCEFVFQNYKNMLKVLDLSLPRASVDTLYFDPYNHPISENFLIEWWIYVNANCPESLGEYLIMVKESPFASICSPQKFFQIRHNFDWDMSSLIKLSNHMLGILIASLVVNYLENLLLKFPIIRTFIKLSKLYTNFGFTGFADLNFLYWTMFGRSSLELSALVPRDLAANKKAIMYLIYDKLFGGFNMPDYPILPFLKPIMTKFVQLINLCWPIMADFDFNAIYKIKPFFDNKSFSGTWAPLDHLDSVEKVLEELKKGKIPVVTAKTGARKSTDFVQNISAHFNCTMLSMPRVLLVKNHASSAPKLFAGTRNIMDENNLNVCTHGWLQVTNHSFKDKDFLIIIDEFHEMDEDSLILLERYKGNVILLSATPIPIPNSTTITLSKSRSPYSITKLPPPPNIHLESAIFHYLNEYPKLKTLIIIPSLSQCIKVHNTIASFLSRKIRVVDAKNDEIKDDTEIIIGTSVWDAGRTWTGCQLVIDSGLSMGKVNGKFITRESSHAIEIQRAGRTG
ncbi:14307_t:CDS:2 [Dentiscutata erythropus]|uniref:14307_t:CDS:1 n=1 Tax=Dentiscutata erythropus TaxID=1348616 RepID=A0A9N9HQ09_9GLOM|nr:14307_t:CDS:2 [Dentiscutata erythropus]